MTTKIEKTGFRRCLISLKKFGGTHVQTAASDLEKLFLFKKNGSDALSVDLVRHIQCQGLARFGKV
ncbi:hypothetical protein CFter6_2787 [Collimonas fungivorans]|uniref:Uncharacterized protein n=1 Tax=Collimonas fungivorans TaxID=158899 RepID=A0A127PCX2_9BURK|nr:hypothetical protein [Collimonas fungivorans]AMO95454.1 hypothetical protein CFter6_2787 [Collimonas fungivorans]